MDEAAAQLEEARRELGAARDLATAERERVAALEQARSAAAQVSVWVAAEVLGFVCLVACSLISARPELAGY